jgi:hypothetical protein
MLEKRDLELIKELREVVKEEVQASEARLEEKIEANLREVVKEEVQASEARLEEKISASEGSLEEKIASSVRMLEEKIESRVTESENILLEEMDRLYQKSKENLKDAIDKVDVIKATTRLDRLESRVDELERKGA